MRGEIDLLLARQREQHVDRPLIALEIDHQLGAVRDAARGSSSNGSASS